MAEPQTQPIIGYRELSDVEIATLNEIKVKAAEVGTLLAKLRENQVAKIGGTLEDGHDRRWLSLAEDHLQLGFMAMTRAVAKPTSF